MSATDALRLYDYPASCNCYKVRLLLSQLGRSCERVPIDIFDGETLTEEYAAINPPVRHRSFRLRMGRSPSRTPSSYT
ncbi:MAG: hypothetical protein E6G33_05470 [Actinobacteria bacterium]|nr:MAG: hypothetical protein E6G33_05470 [Actinomycetota bacterium]